MASQYQHLDYAFLPRRVALEYPECRSLRRIRLDDPASAVLTDFSKVVPHTIGASASIDEADLKMRACGIRALFVTDGDGMIQGLVTAADYLGDRLLRVMYERSLERTAVTVGDLMTRIEALEAVPFQQVLRASVGSILETLKLFGRQHLLVTKHDAHTGTTTLCGMISLTQLEHQLGTNIICSENTCNTLTGCHIALGRA